MFAAMSGFVAMPVMHLGAATPKLMKLFLVEKYVSLNCNRIYRPKQI